MKTNILINLLDKHNEANLIATDKLKPKKVIYLKDKENDEICKDIEIYHKKIFSNIEIEFKLINNEYIKSINEILNNLSIKDTVVNITGGKRICSIILLNQCILKGFKIIYVDVLNKDWYTFGKEIMKSSDQFNDIYLEGMLKLTGTDLVIDSTDLGQKKDIINLTQQIYSNLDLWYKYKQKLHDPNIFLHDYINNKKMKINLQYIEEYELNILNNCLQYLRDLNDIEYKETNNQIEVNILNDYLKSFIFKSGTWLEVLTNMVIKEIIEVDETKCGVVFLWKEGRLKIRNELDVLAVKDSVLICISCKDSEKYDENALNELNVYSKRIGGDNAKKILVATKYPYKECVTQRAKAMGIELVIIDKNINIFKEKLRKIINKN